MKPGQLIEYIKRNIFLEKLCGKWGRDTSSRPLFIFLKKASYEVKVSGLQLSFNVSIALNLAYNKKKLYKTLKLVSPIFYQIFIFLSNDGPLKAIKNVFHFI